MARRRLRDQASEAAKIVQHIQEDVLAHETLETPLPKLILKV
jgi:hypothetical protein